MNFKSIFKYFLLLIIIVILLYNNIYLFSEGRNTKNIFNRKLYIIEDEMMEDTLKKNDIAIINTSPKEYSIGDIILFFDSAGLKLERIHEIVDVDMQGEEKRYITKADKSNYLNNLEIKDEYIVGKYTKKIPKLGNILKIIRSRVTTIIFISILTIVLFLLIQIRLYRPSREKGKIDEQPIFEQLKDMLKKDKEKVVGRHSRKVQKERVKKRYKKNNKLREE